MKFSLFLGMIPSSWRLLKCLKKNQRALTEMYAACRNPKEGRIELIKVKLKTIVHGKSNEHCVTFDIEESKSKHQKGRLGVSVR